MANLWPPTETRNLISIPHCKLKYALHKAYSATKNLSKDVAQMFSLINELAIEKNKRIVKELSI